MSSEGVKRVEGFLTLGNIDLTSVTREMIRK
jgi:hypothetical protein